MTEVGKASTALNQDPLAGAHIASSVSPAFGAPWVPESSAAEDDAHNKAVAKDIDQQPLSIDVRAPSPNSLPPHFRKPSDAGLRLKTPVTPVDERAEEFFAEQRPKHRPLPLQSKTSWRSQSSWESTVTPNSAPSPSWSMSSPALANLGDVTPLPSPLVLGQSPEFRRFTRRPHSGSNVSFASLAREETLGTLPAHKLSISPQRKKFYPGLGISGSSLNHDTMPGGHVRDRSFSDFVPEHLLNSKLRNVTAPVAVLDLQKHSHHIESGNGTEQHLQREEYLSKQRGYILGTPEAPLRKTFTPPESSTSTSDDDDFPMEEDESVDTIVIRGTTWRVERKLGRGAFSEVVLASRADHASRDVIAIKIVDHNLAKGSDEERMGTSINREIELLQDISHPCLPKLVAFENNDSRALLAMKYCAGGDLFELATEQKDILLPAIVQRIFAELVDAVQYLHSSYIVHRDIKLENVLLNFNPSTLRALPTAPSSYPYALITLTDLGLSKRIPEPPNSPLLTHACGSPDYAAPELLLGQPYDGRLTDGWALGVLLYALIEGRLPFDPLPVRQGMTNAELKRRGVGTSIKHRIARCDWLWCEFGNDEGEWVGEERGEEGRTLEGARLCVEGVLKKVNRGRWNVEKLRNQDWVKLGIQVEGGLR